MLGKVSRCMTPCPSYVTIITACLNGGILIWQNTWHRWNSFSSLQIFTWVDFATRANYTSMTDSSEKTNLRCEGWKFRQHSWMPWDDLTLALKRVPDGAINKGSSQEHMSNELSTTRKQVRTQRSPILTNIGIYRLCALFAWWLCPE